jgi:hypothetical protein
MKTSNQLIDGLKEIVTIALRPLAVNVNAGIRRHLPPYRSSVAG